MYLNIIQFYRLGRFFRSNRVPFVPMLFSLFIFLLFSSKVPFSVTIGRGTFFSHRGIAVVLHPEVVIGERCIIGTCVTLGGRGKGEDGAPRIGDDVYIATGAKVLGAVYIGDGATIGANAVVLCDVPAGATAVGVPARVIMPT